MAKIRLPISTAIARSIKIEAGFKCAMPHCNDKTGLEIHHIDLNPANNLPDNLLLLCANHHSQATKGEIDRKACRDIKMILWKSGEVRLRLMTRDLNSRKEYVDTAIAYLSKNPQTYRSTVVGPLMLHPKWYSARRNARSQYSDYEAQLFEYVKKRCRTRCHDIRFILRNSKRYEQKVEPLLPRADRTRFIDGIVKNS